MQEGSNYLEPGEQLLVFVNELKSGVKSFEIAGRLNLSLALSLTFTECNPREVRHGCHHKAMNLINSISFVLGHFFMGHEPLTAMQKTGNCQACVVGLYLTQPA